ncbi:MAG: ABC transporter permease [Bacteroidales bacterium]
MFSNLIKSTVRYIFRHFGYSLLNIVGLTLGITSALFLIIYAANEMGYDRYHEKADRIYRVSSTITEPDDEFTWIVAQIPFGPQVAQDYPEVEAYVRFISMGHTLFKYEDKEFNEDNFNYVDSTLFDVFSYKVLKGEVKTALTEPNKIVLTSTVAAKYFGDLDPIGKSLITKERTYEVTGVIEDVPFNSHFRFDAVASRNNLPRELGSWGNFGVFTYLLLPENTDVKAFENKIQGMYDKYMKPIFESMGIKIEYQLEPLTRIHLFSTNASEPEPTGSITYVYIFAIVAVFLVLIAAMNYINLATARSSKRAREVGLRKVVGSERGPIIMQFLSESVVLTFISLVISLVLVIVLLPKFNELAGRSFSLHAVFSFMVLVTAFGILLMVGILGGSYPAFILSRYSAVTVLKGEITQGSAGSFFRRVLIVIQFAVSAIMILCTLVVFKQLHFMKHMDQGFDQNNVITLQLDRNLGNKYPLLKQALLENREIKYVTSTNTPLGEGSGKVIFNVETDEGMVQKGVNFAVVDHDFIETLGIKMKSGRDFMLDMPSDTLRAVVVNETFVERMAWKEPLGKKVELGDSNTVRASVIGVMKDYHQTGMYNDVESLLLVYRELNNMIYVKLSGDNTQETLNFIETTWHDLFPDQPYSYTFLTDRFKGQFKADEKRGQIFTLFTLLAIFIACIGLFGLASYMVEQRTKEIGIRKVLGASEGTIMKLISKEFMLLAGAGIIIAVPIAWYFMNNWLKNYTYKTHIGVTLVLITALITVIITFVTVSYKAYQASTMNPANSIKTE